MEKKVLVVGENSFIAKHLLTFDKVSYYNFNDVDLSKYDTVINCALNPLFKTNPYSEFIDVDLSVGKRTCESGLHYIMLSTSKVYGDFSELKTFNEFSTCIPYDRHSENKLIAEIKLLSNFPQQTTILRGSNIFGFEYGRNSFMGYCMSQLVNNNSIKLTTDWATQRDFLPVDYAANLIEKICKKKPLGVYNLSSGEGLRIGQLIQWLIDGYKYKASIINTTSVFERQFILDKSKLEKALDIKIGPIDYETIFYYLGKRLCKI